MDLHGRIGGSSPVLEGLLAAVDEAAMTLPADRPRVMVALLGGADTHVEASGQPALAATLRERLALHDIRLLLVAANTATPEEAPAVAGSLLELAAALDAVYVGQSRPAYLGEYSSLGKALKIATGNFVAEEYVLKLTAAPGTFVPGATLMLDLGLSFPFLGSQPRTPFPVVAHVR